MHSLSSPTITPASHGVGAIRRAAGELFAGNNTENLVQPRKTDGLNVRPPALPTTKRLGLSGEHAPLAKRG